MSDGKPLRSQAWFGGADKDSFVHRDWMSLRVERVWQADRRTDVPQESH